MVQGKKGSGGAKAKDKEPAKGARSSVRKGKKPDSYNPSDPPKKPAAPRESKSGEHEVYEERKPIPEKNQHGQLVFDDAPDFRPNLTPKEVLQLGSFGGTYFRPIHSGVTGQDYKDAHKEFPEDWFEGLNVAKRVTSSIYNTDMNTYGVKCGTDLSDWEEKGWITELDPFGWFQWYCRFYLGRRTSDDERQLGRAARCFGPTGRWRIQLMNKVGRAGTSYDDKSISPVIRQVLQHWGYVLTERDYQMHKKQNGKRMGFKGM
eukprot:TRINITY_DN663_c0_g1_i5.p1 TRINITY_DN663_c0_g1~~TRINITY_DN663_c0_g1_i5.p1  ORF type:complete len:261 (-),score=62.59 TRINITY_DN663_c0_g1_i5:506-1288(-)